MKTSKMKERKELTNIPIALLIPALGILFFLAVASAVPFKDKIFNTLYPKPVSHASMLETSTNTFEHPVYSPLGVVVDEELTVIDVLPGYPASSSGIKKGDKIEKIDTVDLTKVSQGLLNLATEAFINSLQAGKSDIIVGRDGKSIIVPVSDAYNIKDLNAGKEANPSPTPLPSGLSWF